MIVHTYDSITKEYTGESIAFVDPVKSERLGREVLAFPPYCTEVKVPSCKQGYTLVFDEKNKVWNEVEDYRGTIVFDKKTAKEFLITELGKIPDTYSFEKPLTLNELRVKKLEEVENSYREALEEIIKLGKIEKKASEWDDLSRCALVPDSFKLIPVFLEKKDTVFVTREELNEVVKYLYIRCMLLALRSKELKKEVALARSKKQLNDFEVDFNVDKEIKEYMKLSEEELNEKFSEVIE